MKPHLRLLTRLLALILILGAHHQLRAQSLGYFLYEVGRGSGVPLEGSTENFHYKPVKAVEVISFSFNGNKPVSLGQGGVAGPVQFNPLELVIQDDPNILAGLISKMALGSHYADLVLEGAVTGSGGANEVVFKLELRKVYVSAVNLSGTDGDRAIYNLSLEWEAMRISTWKRKPDGTLEAVTPRSWNRVLGNTTF